MDSSIELPTQCQIAAGSTGINATTGVDSNDCATNAPFTDNADKGDLRLDFQQSDKNAWFLRVSDRKETGINYPTFPCPWMARPTAASRFSTARSR